MDLEVFVHGVPSGEDFYGKEEERQFLGKFYSGNPDRLKFVVQSRKLGKKSYTYYSYIVGKDVKGAKGRSGSYFGLTIRLDAYYGDFMSLFNILDMVFRNKILGFVLEKSSNGFQYKVDKFIDANISVIQEVVTKLIVDLLKDDEVSALKIVDKVKSNYAFNIYDASEAEVENAVLRGSVVSLSPYFQSKATKQLRAEYDEKIQGLNSKLSSIANEKETQKNMIIQQLNSEHKQEMAKVKRENDGCQKEVEELNNRVNQLESEKKILQENLAQISNLFQKIYNPIKNSGEDNKGKDDKNNQGNKFSKGIKNSGEDNKGEDDNNQVNKFSKVIFVFRFFKIIEPFLVLIIFGLLLSLMFPRLNREDNQPSDQDDSKQSSGVDGVASIQPVSSNFEVYHCVNNEAKPDGQPVDSVEKGEWYVAKVIDGAGQDTRDWFLEGATPGNTRNDGIVSFKINSDNTVKIACISSTNSLAFLKELPVIK